MFRFLRRHKTVLFISLAACLVGMLFFGIGTNTLFSSPYDVILKVNGEKVKQVEFERIYRQMVRQRGAEMTAEERRTLNQEALRELIRHKVFAQEAKKYGIRVSDQELQLQLASVPAFQKEGRFDPPTYVQTVSSVFGMTPNEFERMRRRDIAAQKLNQIIASSVHISDDAFQRALDFALKNETDKKRLKELKENPESLRDELRQREANQVFNDWLNQINSRLRVTIVSEAFRQRLEGAS